MKCLHYIHYEINILLSLTIMTKRFKSIDEYEFEYILDLEKRVDSLQDNGVTARLYYKLKYKKDQLERLNNEVESLDKELKEKCPHLHVKFESDYDGHSNHSYYECTICHKYLRNIDSNKSTIVNKHS